LGGNSLSDLIVFISPNVATDSISTSSEALIDCLHPTPAISGYPKAASLDLLYENEGWDRGLFSAPLLFRTTGRELCLVAIRSCLLTPEHIHFFAGAGYVRGSTPEAEWDETEKKIQVMYSVLFGERHERK
jgi:salicylate biosynthesis isochorismate synthase